MNLKQGSEFPDKFSIEFNTFNKDFNIQFSKLSKNDHKYPVKSSDIYIIDALLEKPVEYHINYDEANALFLQKFFKSIQL